MGEDNVVDVLTIRLKELEEKVAALEPKVPVVHQSDASYSDLKGQLERVEAALEDVTEALRELPAVHEKLAEIRRKRESCERAVASGGVQQLEELLDLDGR